MSFMDAEQTKLLLAAAIGRLAVPSRISVEELVAQTGIPDPSGINPRFDLAWQFPAGHDGVSGNFWHGGHQSVPAISDDYGLILLETSMHMGQIKYDLVYWDKSAGHSLSQILYPDL